MSGKIAFYNKINARILAMLLILLAITAIVVSAVNRSNIRRLHEDNFTERVLLSNALIANIIHSEEISSYVEMIKNQGDEFRQRQIQFYHDREDLFHLQKENADKEKQQELLDRLAAFHRDMEVFKTQEYWTISNEFRRLRDVSHSAYVYVMADTGLVSEDGTILYTFIFDADDDSVYESPVMDGLGTCYTGEDESVAEINATKKQMDRAVYYTGNYGELYYAYAPILNDGGDVIAILGTDISIGTMKDEIARSTFLFNSVFIASGVVIILVIYFFLRRSITASLGNLTNTAQELAEGNVYKPTPETALRQRGEIGILAQAVNDMSIVYQDMITSTQSLFDAANIGKLDVRNDETKFKGDIRKVIKQINDTLDATTLYLNSIPESVFIMSKDFEIYFRNERFINYFGNMDAPDFISNMFPRETESSLDSQTRHEFLKERLADALTRQNNNVVVWINGLCFSVILKEIDLIEEVENSVMVVAVDITNLMEEKVNAQAAAEAKSNFLSRMSHEMRTPMNAIIGMTKIANDTDDVSRLKYCLATIGTSSGHLLGIINDVLDMSKIEAGKFELENVLMNIEKTIMKVCNIVIENMEKKNQKFNVVLSRDLELTYNADDLRLSQVITNLLSNAVKFTPQNGKITLTVEKTGQQGNVNTLRFSVADTGIGMTAEQTARLFNAFEQADGSISRKYGGTGLGLAISKNIVEKMGGRIWVESEPGVGSVFRFEVRLERAPHQNTVIFDGIRPENIRLLIVENDDDTRNRFISIVENFGISVDAAANADEAFDLAKAAWNTNRAYDIIFVDYDMPGENVLDIIRRLKEKLDKNTIIIITTFLEWPRIEKAALQNNITRYITKPLFPSSILDAINDVVGKTLKSLDIKTDKTNESSDLSGVNIILAEDVEINQEIFIALLEHTHISVEIAENGLVAVSKFSEDPDKYDLIIMDVQMPEMDGYQATRTIRAMDIPKAKAIPIIAMTANAFKEDVDRCLECGMNDHLSKPIDEKTVIEKIARFTAK